MVYTYGVYPMSLGPLVSKGHTFSSRPLAVEGARKSHPLGCPAVTCWIDGTALDQYYCTTTTTTTCCDGVIHQEYIHTYAHTRSIIVHPVCGATVFMRARGGRSASRYSNILITFADSATFIYYYSVTHPGLSNEFMANMVCVGTRKGGDD